MCGVRFLRELGPYCNEVITCSFKRYSTFGPPDSDVLGSKYWTVGTGGLWVVGYCGEWRVVGTEALGCGLWTFMLTGTTYCGIFDTGILCALKNGGKHCGYWRMVESKAL